MCVAFFAMDTRVCKLATTLITMVLLFRQAEGLERHKSKYKYFLTKLNILNDRLY
jgi:hypothetical protein